MVSGINSYQTTSADTVDVKQLHLITALSQQKVHIDFQIRLHLDPFMIHETFLNLTETAFGVYLQDDCSENLFCATRLPACS
jgi:hypothetical protein